MDLQGASSPQVRQRLADTAIQHTSGKGIDGGQLGHGGGHYDRLLAGLPAGCRRVGFAYDQQVVEVVPTESHDLALHALVTPAGWVDCGN